MQKTESGKRPDQIPAGEFLEVIVLLKHNVEIDGCSQHCNFLKTIPRISHFVKIPNEMFIFERHIPRRSTRIRPVNEKVEPLLTVTCLRELDMFRCLIHEFQKAPPPPSYPRCKLLGDRMLIGPAAFTVLACIIM